MAAEQSWEEWVKSFNAPQAGAPAASAAPATTAGLSQANFNAINQLYDPTFGRDEQIMAGAENAIAGGWGAGGFGLNQTNRLLDSERKANFVLGAQLLEPYLQRDFQAGQGAADRQARMDQIAADGAQALQRLQLSESGATARLTQQEEAEARRQVVAGQQAMQQLTIQEAGDTGRQREQIAGSLANTVISGAMNDRTGSSTARPIAASYDPNNPPSRFNWATQLNEINPGYRPPQAAQSFGLGSSSIDFLLKKYGLIP